MEQKTITVYNFEELKEEVKEKVLQHFRETNDYPFLSENIEESLNELLEKHKIKAFNKPQLRYSLSYSKGDGLSFTGDFEYKGYYITAREGNLSNYYCHYNTIDIQIEEVEEDLSGDITEEVQEVMLKEVEEEFNELYQDICKDLEKKGYDEIEYQDSEEAIKETIEANEYKFLENGDIA